MRFGVPHVGKGNPRTLFCDFDPSFLMISCRRVQAVPSSPLTSGLFVKKPGGLCLCSLQLDLPLQSLAGQNLTAGRGCSEMPGLGMDTRPLGLSRVLRSWNPSLETPFPAPTSLPDTQSLCLSSAVSSLCCPHPKRSPCGPQARLCQLKPHMELCQEGLVGVLPAAGASLQRPRPLKAPQTQGWHVHSSLYYGEGSSPERQLSRGQSFAIRSLLHWTPVSGLGPRTCAVRQDSCFLWGGKALASESLQGPRDPPLTFLIQ